MATSIKIKNIIKNFGAIRAVDDVSLNVNKGEILGLLGPNGAGKTTTIRIATGYITPDQGSVEICDDDMIANPMEAKRHIGYLPEGGVLYLDMRVLDFLKFITRIRNLDKVLAGQRLDFVIEKLHLESVLNQTIDNLSKGYKRRVALAQSLLHDPEILILDEPTDGLDPNQKLEIYELVKDLSKTKAIIISTHILEEVELLCKKIAIINHGKIVASGKIDDLIAKYSVGKKGTKLTKLASTQSGLACVFYNITNG